MLSPQFTNACSHFQGRTQNLLKQSLKASPGRNVLCTSLKRLEFCLRKFGIGLKIDRQAHLELDSLTSIFLCIYWSWLTFFKEALLGPRICCYLNFYFSRLSCYQTRPDLTRSQISLLRYKNLFLSNRIKVFSEHSPGCFDQNLREEVIKKKKKKNHKRP